MACVGLQVLKEDMWVPVKPMPHALVINIGDTLEVLTNGKYKSVEHRAVTNVDTERLSIVTFYAPSYEVLLGPLPELVAQEKASRYKTYNHGEYSRHYVTSRLQGKKTLEFAKISY
jgi:isopenicillin N synthase-like dioxygenase